MECLTAIIDGLELKTVRSDGTRLNVTSITGWDEGPDIDVPNVERAGHGAFAIAGRRRALLPAIEGTAKSPTHLASQALRREFGAILADGGFGDLVIEHAGDVELWATVQRLSVSIKDQSPTLFTWRIQARSPDPYRYGTTSTASTTFASDPVGRGLRYPAFSPSGVMYYGPAPTSNGVVTVTNAGNAPARPVFTVAGPGPAGGFSILDIGSGRRITYLGALPSGSSLVFDSSSGSVVIDGSADRRGDTVVTSWPVVGPGETASYRFAPESTPSAAVLTVDLTDTYY